MMRWASEVELCGGLTQSDHLSGKPGNVREFETCQGNVRDYVHGCIYIFFGYRTGHRYY